MDAKQKMALGLLEIIEGQATEIVALHVVLKREEEEIPDWRELVETVRIVSADKVHRVFEPLRFLCGASPDQNQPPNDLHSVVRRVLDTVLKPDNPSR